MRVERARKFHEFAVVVLAETADGCPCGVLEADELTAFVECFAGGVIAGATDACVLESRFFHHEFCVAARDGKRQKRRFDVRVRKPGSGEVAFEMVHAVSRNVQVAGETFGKACANEERSHEAGTRGVGYCVDVLEFDSSFLDGGFGNGGNLLQVRTGGNFWDNATIKGVFVNLAIERV